MPKKPSPAAITYAHPSAGFDKGRYDISNLRGFEDDPVRSAGIEDLAALAASDNWEDRIRAEVIREHTPIKLPDGFPCIYETVDSRLSRGMLKAVPDPWVVSPDLDMLTKLLPDYQELWDSYTSQWGPSARRVFAVGRLDGLSTHGVYRPGTTPRQVIGSTMLTHTDIYRRAPKRLQEMHPQHAAWAASRAERNVVPAAR